MQIIYSEPSARRQQTHGYRLPGTNAGVYVSDVLRVSVTKAPAASVAMPDPKPPSRFFPQKPRCTSTYLSTDSRLNQPSMVEPLYRSFQVTNPALLKGPLELSSPATSLFEPS